MLTDTALHDLADELVRVPGVVGVLLGGSRARGDEDVDSDVDLGLYYRTPLDTAALRVLASRVAAPRGDADLQPDVTEPGGWGPWVDGGGWMRIEDVPVDWIYRDVDRVARCVELAVRGDFDFHAQTGHPLGVPDFAYAGELALGVLLADPTKTLVDLRARLNPYPAALADAVVRRLDEARFLLGGLDKAARRCDTTFVAGCLFRVVALCAHAVQARAGHWVVNEKGLVASTDRLAGAPAGFAQRAADVLARLGTSPGDLLAAVGRAQELVADVSVGARDVVPPTGHPH